MAGNAVSTAVSDIDSAAVSDAEATEDALDAVEGDPAAPESDQPDRSRAAIGQRLRSRLRGAVGSPNRLGLAVGALAIAVLSGLTIWFGYLSYTGHQAEQQRAAFLAAGRQGALDITTVDYTRVEADIARVVAGSTGAFRDDFQTRAGPFAEEMRRTKSKSVGSVAEAAVESMDKDTAQILVAVKVTTTQEGAPEPRVKGWRMRVSVVRVGADLKVSNVEFVP